MSYCPYVFHITQYHVHLSQENIENINSNKAKSNLHLTNFLGQE